MDRPLRYRKGYLNVSEQPRDEMGRKTALADAVWTLSTPAGSDSPWELSPTRRSRSL